MPPTKNTTNAALAEQYFGQVSESIQLVFDLTSRIDERVKMLIERQNEIDDRIEKLIEMHQQLINRLTLVESRVDPLVREDIYEINQKIAIIQNADKKMEELRDNVHGLELKIPTLESKLDNLMIRIGNHDNRWGKLLDAIWKLALMIIAGFILYKLGLQSPPN